MEVILFHSIPLIVLKFQDRVDGRSWLKCYWTRASCDCGRLPIGDVTREVKFLSSKYTNPDTNPRTLTTLTPTLTDPHGAFESFCAPIFCDFKRNYYMSELGHIDTSYTLYPYTYILSHYPYTLFHAHYRSLSQKLTLNFLYSTSRSGERLRFISIKIRVFL